MNNSNLSHLGLALLRIIPSAFMLNHGIPKFMKLISGDTAFANPIGIGEAPTLFLAVLAEFVCPILIIIGFKTKWAAVPAGLTMLVAAFVVHAADPFKVKESALLYLAFFVIIFLLGPGKFSVDKR